MTQNTQEHSIVAICDSHLGAEAAIIALEHEGLDMKRLSIVGLDLHTEEHAVGFATPGDRMKSWGGRGAFLGTLCGLLFGGAARPRIAMRPLVGWIVGALEGAAVGGAAGVLAAGLTSIGVPKDSVVKYNLAVRGGNFVVLVRGTADIAVHARAVLGSTGRAQRMAHAM